MSSTSVLPPAQQQPPTQQQPPQQRVRLSGNSTNKKKKHERASARKRGKSFSSCGLIEPKPVLPTKFLLGGNINDPLNLNSLQDEEVNRAMNAVTPRSSPLPTPPGRKGVVEVILPPNARDPLRLTDCTDDEEYERRVALRSRGQSPAKQRRRRKKRRTVSASEGCSDAEVSVNASAADVSVESNVSTVMVEQPEQPSDQRPRDLPIDPGGSDATPISSPQKRKRKSEDGTNAPPIPSVPKKFKNPMDKIVSPVVPQPGAWLKRPSASHKVKPARRRAPPDPPQPTPVFKEENKKFQYGNYNRYYGYRNPNKEIDNRLRAFAHHAELFKNKDVLDIGCNVGHITLSVARDLSARSVLGIDIDPNLISAARKNVRHYVRTDGTTQHLFPISMPILYGGVDVPGFHKAPPAGRPFPDNVTFKQCNYVPEDETQLSLEQEQFDVIMCLSVTKWIQLNWGDAGLKLAFRRMYEQLRPGGKLLLEPQHWGSYKSKKKLTETIWRHYNQIELFPDKFRDYLLSPAVGFARGEVLGFPAPHRAAGFRRPIQVYTKSTMFPSERVEGPQPEPHYSGGRVPRSASAWRGTTDRYEAPPVDMNVDHVYADLLVDRYCLGTEDADEVNQMIGEKLNGDNT